MSKIFDLYKFLSLDGLDVATDATGDYSTGETEFRYIAPTVADRVHATPGPDFAWVEISRMMVTIVDAQTLSVWDSYGNLDEMTNGISVQHRDRDDNIITDLTNGHRVTVNGEWAVFCHDDVYLDSGNGANGYSVRWTFAKKGNKGLQLKPGESLVIVLRDDLTGLDKHQFHIQGEGFDRGTYE